MKYASAAPVALFDSGAGGIGVLREVKKLLPHEQLLYFGDSANAPYGERPIHEVRELVLRHGARLLKDAKALVLACNTATAVAVTELRRRYPTVPIIGMEPALRPATLTGEHPTVLVLATAATLGQEKYHILQGKYEKSATVLSISAPGIVRLVEKGLADSPEMDAYLKELLSPLASRPHAVVLGCTHFPFAQNALRRVLGDGIPFFDGAIGTAKELRRQLGLRDLLCTHSSPGGIALTASDPRSLPLLTKLLLPQA